MQLQQAFERALQDLLREPAVLGAALVSRDGLCVRAAGRAEMHRETFSAMTATLMGAAEIALSGLDGGKTRHILAETDRARMVLMGAGRELLLVATLAADAQLEPMLARLRQAAGEIADAASR